MKHKYHDKNMKKMKSLGEGSKKSNKPKKKSYIMSKFKGRY